MSPQFYGVHFVDGLPTVKLTDFAKIVNYSDSTLLGIFKNLKEKDIDLAYKWKRNWYIFLPSPTIKEIELPSGQTIEVNWARAAQESPELVFKLSNVWFLNRFLTPDDQLFVVGPEPANTEFTSSTLSPKKGTPFISPSLGKFPATTEYKYGHSIKYDPNKMSIFNPGSSGTLSSTQIPSAFFEVCRALDAAENLRNGANPGLPPRRNLSTTVSFDTGTIAIAATIPVEVSVQASGSIDIKASDYLGATYSVFNAGGGDLKSDTLPEALLELASILAAAEKAVTPTDSQPNNVQIQFDLETGSATVSANLPFTTSAAANGDVTVHAIDYL